MTQNNKKSNSRSRSNKSKFNLKGCLLAANPQRRESILKRSVIMIVDHENKDTGGTIGLQINKMIIEGITMQTVMENMGLESDLDAPVYYGGPFASNRVSVIHSTDWIGMTTSKINDNFALSNDMSILAALADGTGPKFYRLITGHMKWKAGDLEGELSGKVPWDQTDPWIICPKVSEDLVFLSDGIDQWNYTIETAAQCQAEESFN